MPAAQAQIEPETEGTEELGGSGEHDPEYEHAPEDLELEREEPDALLEPPAATAPDDNETGGRGPGSTAPGILNAPMPDAPSPPPATPPLQPPEDPPQAPAPGMRLGQQPQAPPLSPRVPDVRERRIGPDDRGSRTRDRGSGLEDRGLGTDRPPATTDGWRGDGPSATLPARPGDAGVPPPASAPHQPLPQRSGPDWSEGAAEGTRRGAPRLPAERGPAVYRVRPGDSLWSIAEAQLGLAASGADIARAVDRLWELNGVRVGTGDPDLIMPGTVLRLR